MPRRSGLAGLDRLDGPLRIRRCVQPIGITGVTGRALPVRFLTGWRTGRMPRRSGLAGLDRLDGPLPLQPGKVTNLVRVVHGDRAVENRRLQIRGRLADARRTGSSSVWGTQLRGQDLQTRDIGNRACGRRPRCARCGGSTIAARTVDSRVTTRAGTGTLGRFDRPAKRLVVQIPGPLLVDPRTSHRELRRRHVPAERVGREHEAEGVHIVIELPDRNRHVRLPGGLDAVAAIEELPAPDHDRLADAALPHVTDELLPLLPIEQRKEQRGGVHPVGDPIDGVRLRLGPDATAIRGVSMHPGRPSTPLGEASNESGVGRVDETRVG